MTVKDRVLSEITKRGALGAREIMARTGLGRTVYRALGQLVEEGAIVKLRKRDTSRRKRWIYSLPEAATAPRF